MKQRQIVWMLVMLLVVQIVSAVGLESSMKENVKSKTAVSRTAVREPVVKGKIQLSQVFKTQAQQPPAAEPKRYMPTGGAVIATNRGVAGKGRVLIDSQSRAETSSKKAKPVPKKALVDPKFRKVLI